MAKDPRHRYATGAAMAEDVEDVLAGRPPRHREGWTPPPTGEGTLRRGEDLPELSLEPGRGTRPRRRRRRPALTLVLLLGAAVAAWFLLHPEDRQFWRLAASVARQSAIAARL